MKRCLFSPFFAAALLLSGVMMMMSCTTKDASSLTNIGELQSSIIRIAKAAPNFSEDSESLWAFAVADSLAKSMNLQKGEEAKDLASAYKALSYVAYGLNYGAIPLIAQYHDVGPEYLTKVTQCLVDKDDATACTFGKALHVMELKSDQGFAIFITEYEVDNDELEAGVDEMYEDGGEDAFKNFQLQNRAFFYAYTSIILRLTNEEEQDEVFTKVGEIAEQLDSLPESVTTEEEFDKVFNDIIGARAQMINLMAMAFEHYKGN